MGQPTRQKAFWPLIWAALWLFGTVQSGPAADATSTTFQLPPVIKIAKLD